MQKTKMQQFSECVYKFLCRIIHKEFNEKSFTNFYQFIKFGIVGLSNTIISYVLYVVSLQLLRSAGVGATKDYLLAQFIAFIISVFWSYCWNSKTVFVLENHQKRSFFRSLIRAYIAYSFTGLFLNEFLLMFWVNVLHISEYIGPIINLIITVPLNFIINKYWAFKSVEK